MKWSERAVKVLAGRYKAVLVLAVLLLLGGSLAASRLTVDTGVEDLLPEGNNVIQATQAMETEFGGQDEVLVVVRGEAAAAQAYLEKLADRLKQEQMIGSVLYRIETSYVTGSELMYLPTEVYERLEQELDNPSSPLSRYLAYPNLVNLTELVDWRAEYLDRANSVALGNQYLDLLNGSGSTQLEQFWATALFGIPAAQLANSTEQVYLVSESGSTYLMVIQPRIKVDDLVNAREGFFTSLERAISETQAGNSAFSSLSVGYTGGSFVQDYQGDSVAFDNFISTAGVTFALIILFVVVSFRRILLPLAAGFPLLLGTVLTAAFAVLVYRGLNLFSISFAVLILGLGIDFAIHIIARYLEERSKGLDLFPALANTLSHTGVGMLIGAVTTAVAFAAFVFAEFRAFTQMGVISAVGILIALAVMVVVVPALIAAFERRQKAVARRSGEFTFLRYVAAAVARYPLAVVVVVLSLAALTWNAVAGASIALDMQALYPQDMPCLEWLQIVQEEFDYDPNVVTVMAANEDELRQWEEKLNALDGVEHVESALNYLPADQHYKLSVLERLSRQLGAGMLSLQQGAMVGGSEPEAYSELLHSLQRLSLSYADLESDGPVLAGLRDLVERLEGSPDTQMARLYQAYFSSLAVLEDQDYQLQPVTVADLPDEVLKRFQGASGKLLLQIHVGDDIWNSQVLTRLAEEIKEVTEQQIAGVPILMHEVVRLVKNDVVRISLIAAVVILLLLTAVFRSIKDALIAMVPVAAAFYLVVGLGRHLGIELNIMNIMALPLILGIGVDSAVHVMHRLRTEGIESLTAVLLHTGKAVTMTTVTTLIGFGSLVFANHPGLASLGKLIVLGMVLCLLLTLTLLPASAVLLEKAARRVSLTRRVEGSL